MLKLIRKGEGQYHVYMPTSVDACMIHLYMYGFDVSYAMISGRNIFLYIYMDQKVERVCFVCVLCTVVASSQ